MTHTLSECLTRLDAMGSERMRAQNRKRGVGDKQYGVKLGDIRKLADQIRSKHELGLTLWQTGNYDARLLAILLMKPMLITAGEMEEMVRAANVAQLADWFNAYLVKDHPAKEELRKRWMKADDPWAARAGWALMAGSVARDPEGLDLPALLDRIEREMSTAPAPTQWTMNSCLAAIGINHPALRDRALAIGERLGIYRDYPVSKGCTSPFAPIWIAEMVKRQNKGSAK